MPVPRGGKFNYAHIVHKHDVMFHLVSSIILRMSCKLFYALSDMMFTTFEALKGKLLCG